jgi:uncharacterized protein
MRCALDSSLLISSTFKTNTPPALVLAAWRLRHIEWVSCVAQIDELAVALFRPAVVERCRGGLKELQNIFDEMQSACSTRFLAFPLPKICRDPRDDYLFALFDQGHVDWIISGDKDVVALKGSYPILTPRELIDRL